MDQNDDYLVHYGVLGMRWGVRKDRDRVGRRKSSGSSEKKSTSNSEHDDLSRKLIKKNPNAAVVNPDIAKKAQKAKKKPKKELTEEERKARNKKIAIGILAGVGTVAAVAATAYVAKKYFGEDSINPIVESRRLKKELDDSDMPTFLSGWLKADAYRYDAISDEAYKKLGTHDLHLKKGTIFQRISRDNETTLRDRIYVAFGSDDKNRYKAFLPGMWEANLAPAKNIYKIALEAGEDIRSPSAKKRVDILQKVFEDNPGIAKRAGLRLGSGEKNPAKLAKKYYNRLASIDMMNQVDPIAKTYIKEVLNQGYNAILDDNDAGRLAKNPLILLTGSKSIKNVSSTKLTGKDMLEAAKNVKKSAFDISNGKLKGVYDKFTYDYMHSYYLNSIKKVIQQQGGLSSQAESRIKSLRNSGKTLEEIAETVGLSVSTIEEYI